MINLKKEIFSKLDVENSEENHIYNIEKTYEINPKEQIPYDTEKIFEKEKEIEKEAKKEVEIEK